jgi:translocation and assembly module TamA
VNYGWTGRYFNSTVAPTRGHGLAVELGAGTTLHPDRAAFVRTLVRWQSFIAAGRVQAETGGARNARIALRAEAGAVMARQTAQIPVTQLFLTGGDTTVRGYGYRPSAPAPKTTCFMAAAIWAWPASNGSAPSFTTAP